MSSDLVVSNVGAINTNDDEYNRRRHEMRELNSRTTLESQMSQLLLQVSGLSERVKELERK